MAATEGHNDDPCNAAGGRGGAASTGPLAGHAVIAGFGLSGRAAANALIAKGIPICVIERNVDTVRRCSVAGLRIFQGDATDEGLMRRAGIESAVLFAATMPDDPAVLEAVALARRLNPGVRIIARCEYVSTGMKAERKGADEVVIAEKVVATEFGRAVEREALPAFPPDRPPAGAMTDAPASPPSPPPREPSVVGDTP